MCALRATWGLMQVYRCGACLVRAAGWGAVRDLTPTLLPCLLLELYSSSLNSDSGTEEGLAKSGGGSKAAKKRKRAKAEQDAPGALGPGSAPLTSPQVAICTQQRASMIECLAGNAAAVPPSACLCHVARPF